MFSLWTWKVQNCFKLQTPPPPPQHLSRTQFLLKLHSSFNHKKNDRLCQPNPTLRHTKVNPPLQLPAVQRLRCAERCASELPLKSPPDRTNTLASVDVQKYAATHIPVLIFSELFLIFLLSRDRQVSLHSFPLTFHQISYRFCFSLAANSVLTKCIFRHSLFHFSYTNTL